MMPKLTDSPGQVVSFYSFKGGTGRTMALANVALVLAEAGNRVLTIDFDLEAPGLSSYFEEAFSIDLGNKAGLIELLSSVSSPKQAKETWKDYCQSAGIGSIDIITSGRRSDEYASLVAAMSWDECFSERQGGEVLEELRACWAAEYDFVLIDSRTGFTDTGGICTIHLPDVIVPMCTPNHQSIEGIVDVVKRAQRQRLRLVHQRGPALVFPLMSRIDDRTEKKLATEWLDRAEKELGDFVGPWLPINLPVRQLIERTKLPYVTFYSFGEDMPVRTDNPHDPGSLGAALRTVAAVIGSRFENLFDLLGERGPSAPGVLIADGFRTAFSSDAQMEEEALAVLARLWQFDSATGRGWQEVAVPADLLGNSAAITVLTQLGMVSETNGLVTANSLLSPADFPPLTIYIERNTDVLRWAAGIRQRLTKSLDRRLVSVELEQALKIYEERPNVLTSFERSIVEESLTPPATLQTSMFWGMSILVGLGMMLGALVGGIAIALQANSNNWVTIGVCIGGGALIGLYTGSALAESARARFKRQDVLLDMPTGWASMKSIANALDGLGYRPEVHGTVAIFRLLDAGSATRILLALWKIERENLPVVVRSSTGSDTIRAAGPQFALGRLQSLVREE